jgi:hypothetical protein
VRRLLVISLVVSAALAAAAPTLAQTSDKIWRLGVLTPGSLGISFRTITLPELAKQGFVEGGILAAGLAARCFSRPNDRPVSNRNPKSHASAS